ncbi:hypothetical protein [Moraxella atlantae]|uniref:ADP-ribosyl-(Dinitrogen reductase) hydrolase n=1 Tax=Faucicola atlantae TaxID=34059 RepID=A0A378Q3V1_9GAMM|nr:hypothetical protein [Moraxella atlantae]OPH34934.1 hypothetical protein B5J92_06295 [Moraxella atlantae]STY95206.1 Uncharacterised protein [Moraxella atlantae]
MTQPQDNEPRFVISPKILAKLNEKHAVTEQEVIECFYNSDDGDDLEDTREQHQTLPPTLWFLAYTDKGRLLKVCFVFQEEKQTFYVKSAYEPNTAEITLFNALTGKDYYY